MLARLLAATLLAVPALTSCTTGDPEPRQVTPAPRVHIPNDHHDAVARLLETAWISDGREGFFIDSGDAPGAAVSLYATRWWYEVAKSRPSASLRVRAEEVKPWLDALVADPKAGAGDVSGVPRLAVLQASAELADALGISVDTSHVVQEIEGLRVGGLYRDAPGSKPTRSATAIAASILNHLDRPVPAAVTTSATSAIKGRNLTSGKLNEDDLSLALTLRQVVDPSKGGPTGEWLLAVTREAQAQVAKEPTAAAIPLLRSLEISVGSDPRLEAVCSDLTASTGKEDPHLLADAQSVGCDIDDLEIPPHGVRGWPSQQALSDSMRSTVYGLELATALSQVDRYRDAIALSYAEWSTNPSTIDQATQAGGPSMLRIAGMIGADPPSLTKTPPEALNSLDLAGLEVAKLSDPSDVTVGADTSRQQREQLKGMSSQPESAFTSFDALALRSWSQQGTLSSEVLKRFCRDGLCSLTVEGQQPSLVATSLAHWDYRTNIIPVAL